jgi:sentrin-specific protease 1
MSVPSSHKNVIHSFKGYDCGVFTCMFADFLSKDDALLFGQQHVTQCRERIALSILNGQAIM